MQIPTTINLDTIQTKCGYTDLDTMRVVWKGSNPGVAFPKRHEQIPEPYLLPFLEKLATPGRGKGETVIGGATELLALFGLTPTGSNGKLPQLKDPPPPPSRTDKTGSKLRWQDKKPIPPPPPIPRTIEEPAGFKTPEFVKNVSKLNGFAWLTIISVLATTYGCWVYFDLIGILIAVIYAIILFEAVRAARNKSSNAERAVSLLAVIALEVLAGFIHFGWLNVMLWRKLERIPFNWTSTEKVKMGTEWVESTVNTTPGIIAFVFAIFISTASFYAVLQQMNRTTDSMWD